MLKNGARWGSPFPPFIFLQSNPHQYPPQSLPPPTSGALKLASCSSNSSKDRHFGCWARRRVRYEEEEDGEKEYEYNPDIAMLELYSQSVKQEALIVRATVDESEEEILIFKGFSSGLSHGTSPDPSQSILPSRAVIESIDRVKGPFNPKNIEYIEMGLTLEDFKARFRSN
uniref:DUF7734 domain-containing protein n=1 Tax=Kalanchoe fedtschenkoi TaxID=63787 RepID=A0A7N0TFW1_KALFE